MMKSRYIRTKTRRIEVIGLLLTIGITVSGISNNFEVLTQSCDVCFEILKESTDSYINLDNFKNSKTITLHEK